MTLTFNPLYRPLLVASVSLVVAAPLHAEQAQYRFDLPAQALDQSISALARQTGARILFNTDATHAVQAPALNQRLSVAQALGYLIANSSLILSVTADGQYLIALPAEPSNGALELETSSIIGRQPLATTEGSRSYTSGAVTLGKGVQKLKDIPQSVTVMTRKQMDDQNTETIADLVARTPGLTPAKSPGSGLFIYSRGFSIDTIQYDGVPIPRNTYSLGSYLTEDLSIYDRAEILRGPAALLQGGDSPGGAMNLVRKRGQQKATVSLTGKAGSWDRYGLQLDAGGPLNESGTLRGRTVVNQSDSGSFVDYVRGWNQTVYGAIDYDFSPDLTVGIGMTNQKGHSRPAMLGIPRFADGGNPDWPRSSYVGADWNRANNDQNSVFLDASYRLDDNWRVKAAGVYMSEHNGATYQALWDALPTNGSTKNNYIDWSTDFTTHSKGLDLYLDGQFTGFGFEQTFLLGANYSHIETDDRWARAPTPLADSSNVDHHRPMPDIYELARRGLGQLTAYEVEQKGLYTRWSVNLTEPLKLILGGRTSWFDYTYSGEGFDHTGYSESTTSTSGKVSPYAGLVYDLNDQWSVYTSYTDVFQPQTARTASGSVVEPVTGSNYELGLKGELYDGAVNTSIALFRYDQENRAMLDRNGDMDCDGWYCSKASGKVRSQGLEAQISGEVLNGLQMMAGYVYNTTKYLEDADYKGKVFSTWTPKHQLKLWGEYTLPGDWNRTSVGLGTTAVTGTTSYDHKFDLPGYAVWDARIAYRINDEVSVAANLNNLFDKKYYLPAYSTIDYNNYYGDPRNVMFSVKYTPVF
ncbi:TonB-dependent siderophore receptor [Pseudomonas auratipiscis]|uniref:TonB-dependent siderophore receptor n=1 Tax=Pseudomonas auratipiscis TaxID=3115853 RepID=A0AB35WRR0_9PSED|nr:MULTISPECIES: TonB-dependent siderophore receptor [unclassified Pseudomonas]MEE1865791.1 TonB-dependent siderophore receptor [Pseudomonas sp. 120P]MEE1957040.1 TonB-dependent siderophore receptor [Pseudomonas sp. 119P]